VEKWLIIMGLVLAGCTGTFGELPVPTPAAPLEDARISDLVAKVDELEARIVEVEMHCHCSGRR
jgi:hypothetical protein